MILFKIIGIALITLIATLIVKQVKPEYAIFVSLVGSIFIIFEIVEMFSNLIDAFLKITELTGVNKELFQIVLKIVGIGYITEFTSNLCIDAGMSSIADKVLLGGKVIILVVALPIIDTLIEIITNLLNLC